jgi:hypothetical protein
MDDTQESFFGLLECFGARKTNELHFHPLNFKYLLIMQESNKSIMKILEKIVKIYTTGFPWGRKIHSLTMSQKQNSSTKSTPKSSNNMVSHNSLSPRY